MLFRSRTLYVFIVLLIIVAVSAILVLNRVGFHPEGGYHVHPDFQYYRDIPGVTDAEIEAVEDLRKQRSAFVYGMIRGAEAFLDAEGNIDGYSVLFCDWLAQLFGMAFEPRLYTWDVLNAGLESGTIDFTGDMVPLQSRQANYLMTDPIAERPVQIIRKADGPALSTLGRRPVYGYLTGTFFQIKLIPLIRDEFIGIPFSNFDEAVRLLNAGRIDAFFREGPYAEYTLDESGGLTAEDFRDIGYEPVSLATRNRGLKAIISVVDKALRNGASRHLSKLYGIGLDRFKRFTLNKRLTEEEREYIRGRLASGRAVPILIEHGNYPISFFNPEQEDIQGIAPDILAAIAALTGLKFKPFNKEPIEFERMLEALRSGEAAMGAALVKTGSREHMYLWSDAPYLMNRCAFISKADSPDIDIYDVSFARIGYRRGTAFGEVLKDWFPTIPDTNIIGYQSYQDTLDGLDRDEVDLVIFSEKQIIGMTNIQERFDVKINMVLTRPADFWFAFAPREEELRSIVNKAQAFVDVKEIADRWTYKRYGYQAISLRIRYYAIILLAFLLLIVLGIFLVLYLETRNMGRRLEHMVRIRTRQILSANARTKLIFDVMPLIVSFWTEDFRNIDTNQAAVKLFELKDQDEYIKRFFELSPERQPDGTLSREGMIEHIATAFQEGHHAFEWEHRKLNGERIPVEMTLECVTFDNHKMVIGYTRDLREQKAMLEKIMQTEKELLEANDMILAASRAKSEFLAQMSHEVRTPMNTILGMAELVLRRKIPRDIREDMLTIRHEGRNLLRIINDILDFSKIESGKIEILQSEYWLASLLHDIVNAARSLASEKSIFFLVNVDNRLPSLLFGDIVRIRQILMNIISNAFKYTESGYISFSVEGENGADGEILIRFRVRDTGIGIREEDMGKLFHEFTRVNLKRNSGVVGTGLGLVIAKKLSEAMGGSITVASKYGEGSEFVVSLKQGVRNAAPVAAVNLPETKDTLVYEYRPIYSDSIKKTIESLGVHSESVKSRAEFEKKVNEQRFTYVFVASALLEEALPVIPLGTMVVAMSEFREIVPGNIQSVTVPLHAISLANVFNGLSGNSDTAYRKSNDLHMFSAPDASVLVVDDLATNLRVVKGLLEPFESRVDTVLSGEEAIRLVQKHAYDIVFMDHMMPGMDGIEATTAIRALPDECFKTLPIVALTANAMAGMREMFLDNGFNDYLSKPIEVIALRTVMDRWIPAGKRKKPSPKLNKDGDTTILPEPIRIQNVNVSRGIHLSGSEEHYLAVLALFCKDAEERLPTLAAFPERRDFPLFTTQVHAIRSASASIGAEMVSEEAGALEHAGRNEDLETITAKLSAFCGHLSTLVTDIHAALIGMGASSGDDEETELDRDQLLRLRKALETENIREVDLLIDALAKKAHGDAARVMSEIAEQVLLSKFDLAILGIDSLLAVGKTAPDHGATRQA